MRTFQARKKFKAAVVAITRLQALRRASMVRRRVVRVLAGMRALS
jgi:hypothetical protein